MASGMRPTYRDADGCCICGRKSSTSRFATSEAYEKDFEDCFSLSGNRRHGRLCNPCVLIIKRFRENKKKGEMNFRHVSWEMCYIIFKIVCLGHTPDTILTSGRDSLLVGSGPAFRKSYM